MWCRRIHICVAGAMDVLVLVGNCITGGRVFVSAMGWLTVSGGAVEI